MGIFFRVSEALSDVFQGLFQQKERLDIAGKSLFLRNTISTIVFALTLVISKIYCGLLFHKLLVHLFLLLYSITLIQNFSIA